jgi:UDP-glucose 4-epimerase
MNLQDKRVLVTGGAGFIGSSLCEHLVVDNDVVVVDDCSNGDAGWLPEDVAFVDGDLRDDRSNRGNRGNRDG